jgi:hypothetical protein
MDGVIIAWLDRFSRPPIAEAITVHDEIKKGWRAHFHSSPNQ